ncbi:hypothetical protein [Rhodophyticola sp.]|jgi:hypothetical protein|uniref:hypothetical protein n=1 Tax=Rhodophyticola sp. TaxID=2680032 RepID=UPI001B143482|nr:hypothetical protein [Roseicyclus sp.]MBO6623354.1 hypothetical protein [Roseicyclus sp.]MBO6922202.1 hypothetical protein [Roseicyclus sp.]
MPRALILTTAAALALAACTVGPPRPLSVSLTDTTITVPMSNGTTCTDTAPPGAAAGWSGRLQGCPTAYAYTVEIDDRTNPVRYVLEEIFTALGGPDVIAPLATVTITDGTGRTRTFASPPPLPEN